MRNLKPLERLFTRKTYFSIDAGEYDGVHAGDMMSLVLSRADKGNVLFTALNHVNCVAVAVMMGLPAIVFCEGEEPKMELLRRAEEEKIAIFSTKHSVAQAILLMHEAGCL